MRANRGPALAYVFVDEGGYVERNTEPGGAGNFGISFERFKAWRAINGKPPATFADLKAMSKVEAAALYDKFFLTPAHFDDLPAGVDYVVLDGFINGGGLLILQRALGVKATGHFDPVTLWAAKHREPKALINRLCDVRLARNKTLRLYRQPTKPGGNTTFGRVWDRRTELVRSRALKMAGN
jgi:lysozyme family protein